MKIVINKCYGGFGLSHEAMLKYFEYKGLECYPEKCNYGMYTYWKVPKEERVGILSDAIFRNSSIEERRKSNALHESMTVYESDIPRDDPALIRVVEEMKDKANGKFAKLSVVEMPEDVAWKIEEYDGREWVAEVHRTWG